jgi:chaperonin GroES
MADDQLSADTSQDEVAEGEMELSSEQANNLDRALAMSNMAEKLKKDDPDKLRDIGQKVVEGFVADEGSREDWMERNKSYMKLATQVMERKTWPWDGAANVKYPLLTTASLQFASRAYSSLVPSFDVVKAKVIGNDDNGQMTEVANKLSTHMSYQVMYEIDDWEESMDKLCFVLPIVGSMFKKVYYSNTKKKICSDLLSPRDVVVNYYTKKICNATRITEIQYYTVNEIKEFENKGEWITYDQPFTHGVFKDESDKSRSDGSPPPPDEETPRKFLVQYCWIDLDDDDYKEPYIVTVDEETRKVVRIVANFYSTGVEYADEQKKKVACIRPAEWFVKFDFLPNPDGGFYGIGFGILLGGLNDMVNTITNQLIDAGTLSNLQAGFIGRGLRDNKQKKMAFTPGEWKWVNNPGKDLKENIFPLPVREPSATLFQLLGTLVQSGKEVASVAEIFTGKMPGQNTPAATTMASIEQGLKVFTSIYKRIYRGMGKEFELIFECNKRFMPTQTVKFVGELNGQQKSYGVSRFDYQDASVKIIPAADPNMVSETQKLLKIQGLYELVQYGTINTQEMTRQALVFQGQESITKLMEVPPPPPPLEIQIEQMKQQAGDKDRQLEAMKIMSENQKRQSEMVLNFAKAKEMGDQQGAMMLEMQLKREEAQMEMQMKMMELIFKQEEHKMDMQFKQEEHGMDMQVKATEAQANMAMAEQDLQFNEKSNEKQLEQMDSKHEMQMQQTKEKNKLKKDAKPRPVG